MPMTLNNSGSLKKLPASTLNGGHEKKDVWNELSNHLSLSPPFFSLDPKLPIHPRH